MTTFKYLICLDFEATCWARNENKENAEIIGKIGLKQMENVN